MKRRHWTAYVVGFIALATILFGAKTLHFGWKQKKLCRAIESSGGWVDFETPKSQFKIRSLFSKGPFEFRPLTAFGIESGSHPIPSEIAMIKDFPSAVNVNLTTLQTGDHIVPILCTFQNTILLDIAGSEISADGAIQILEALPEIKHLFISSSQDPSGKAAKAFPAKCIILQSAFQ